jgi:hypothetical protein
VPVILRGIASNGPLKSDIKSGMGGCKELKRKKKIGGEN